MKRLRQHFQKAFIAVLLTAWIAYTPTADANILKSGADCNAANLGQALLGIATNQIGIINNASIPLFIVCSVDVDRDNNFVDVFIEGIFPAGGGTIPCTFRVNNLGGGGFRSAALIIVSGTFNSPAISPSILPPITPVRGYTSVNADNGDGTVNALDIFNGLSITVVCALDPDEGIGGVASINEVM